MIDAIQIEDVGTFRMPNSYQWARIHKMQGPNRQIAPLAFGLGMTISQFKTLSREKQQEVWQAYCKLTAPPPTPERKPRPPAKGEHVPIERQVFIGRQLIDIRASLPRGHFRRWVEDHSGISYTQAQRFIKAAQTATEQPQEREAA